jgi:hypothetical protein
MWQTFKQIVTSISQKVVQEIFYRIAAQVCILGAAEENFEFSPSLLLQYNDKLKSGDTLRRFLSLKLGKCKWSTLTHSLLTSG